MLILSHPATNINIRSTADLWFKADPYAKAVGKLPESASVIDSESTHEWRDAGWLEYRRKNAGRFLERPMNIYELHLGSFMHTDDGVALDYVTLAHELAPYVKQMGYKHIEMLPIMEYDSDASAGYSSCCFFALSFIEEKANLNLALMPFV